MSDSLTINDDKFNENDPAVVYFIRSGISEVFSWTDDEVSSDDGLDFCGPFTW